MARSTLGTTYLCLMLPRLAQEAPKSVLSGGVATHKNRATDTIPNRNSILLGPSRERVLGGGGGGGGGVVPNPNSPTKTLDTHFFIVVDKINLINKNQPKNWPTPLHKCCSPINLYCKGQSPKEGGPFPKEKVGRGC